jgi:SOS-response transcriptional repressor LexA
LIPLNNGVNPQLSKHAFALKMPDDSMEPELRRHDILIIDPDKIPQPGSFVVAKVDDNTEVIVRRYKQLSAAKNSQQFELLAINQHWAGVVDGRKCALVGAVCGLFRFV